MQEHRPSHQRKRRANVPSQRVRLMFCLWCQIKHDCLCVAVSMRCSGTGSLNMYICQCACRRYTSPVLLIHRLRCCHPLYVCVCVCVCVCSVYRASPVDSAHDHFSTEGVAQHRLSWLRTTGSRNELHEPEKHWNLTEHTCFQCWTLEHVVRVVKRR